MKSILNKYYKISNKEKEEMKEICILDEIQEVLQEKKIVISNAEKIIMLNIIKKCNGKIDKSLKSIINKLIEIIKQRNLSLMDINCLSQNELFRLLIKKDNKCHTEILKTFIYGRYKCLLLKNDYGLILTYENDEGIQYVDNFKNTEDILVYVIKNKLLSRGENIV